MWVPRRHARMATIHITRMRARLMATMVRSGFREACSLAPVPGITVGTVATATDAARIMVAADGLAADTIGRAPMHTVAGYARGGTGYARGGYARGAGGGGFHGGGGRR